MGHRPTVYLGIMSPGAHTRGIVDWGEEPFVERCARFYAALEPRIGMDLLAYTPSEFEAIKNRPFLRHALRDAIVIYEA